MPRIRASILALGLAMLAAPAFAHAIGGKDAAFVASSAGAHIGPFLYLGAKHMVTGYDHLLFILGVIFFLYRPQHVALYVTLFSLGHSITLLAGALLGWKANPYIIDAIIGFSVAYKAFDNLDGFKTLFGWTPDTRLMVLVFGLFHGLGLATKLEDLHLSHRGLAINLVSFNVGVEIGQLIALSLMLGLILLWRRSKGFAWQAAVANVLILTAGFVLMQEQIAGYILHRSA